MSSDSIRFDLPWAVTEAATKKTAQLVEEDKVAVVKAHKIRQRRLLKLEEQSEAIKRATTKYAILARDEEPYEIRIRKRFIRLERGRPPQEDDRWPESVQEKLRADVDSRPPLTKLIQRPSKALQVYLSLLYVAQLEFKPGDRWRNERPNSGSDGWGTLCGLREPGTSNKELNLRLTRALSKLADHDLVRVGKPKSRKRFDDFTLHREDKPQTYFAPSIEESRSLPKAFFTAGWHLVLTDDEIATLLAIIDQTERPRSRKDADQVGVALPVKMRWAFYGLSPEAFAARHELEEFGLIESFDPMARNHGKLSEEQRKEEIRAPRITMKLNSFDFSVPAAEVVKSKLANPVPPRLVPRAINAGLLDSNQRWKGQKTPTKPDPTG